MSKVIATVLWQGDRKKGEALLAAISPDDPDDFVAELHGGGDSVELRIYIESDSIGRSRSTVDDVLACLAASESGLDSIK